MTTNYYIRKDGTFVRKDGRYKSWLIFKRPHGGYCCFVFWRGVIYAGNGYHPKALPTKRDAVRWGNFKLKESGKHKIKTP